MKNKWERLKATHAAIAAVYQGLFDLDRPVPFKIGLDNDLAVTFPELSRTQAKRLLAWLTNRRAYLYACRQGAPRYGLGGISGTVTAEEAAHARQRFADRMARSRDDGWAERIAADAATLKAAE